MRVECSLTNSRSIRAETETVSEPGL